MKTQYTEVELDALRELANIGSGTAATALSSMLGQPVDVSVPLVSALPIADAVEAAGPPDQAVTGVALPVDGDLNAVVLVVFPPADAETLCGMLGVEPDGEMAISALGEIVNILGASYLGALGMMTGLELELGPPQAVVDLLAAIMSSVLAPTAAAADLALLLDSQLIVEGQECGLSFMLVPSPGGVSELLGRLGL